MFTQELFGKRLKEFRTRMQLTQKDVATRIGVSVQALYKWENGNCLPDVYHLKLLSQVLKVSADQLLADDDIQEERIVESIRIGEAVFDVVDKPAMVLAGRIIHAKDFDSMDDFDKAIEEAAAHEDMIYSPLTDVVYPISDIRLSVNFWRAENLRAYGFVREVVNDQQAEGVDIFRVPASLYIRAYTDKASARLLLKEQCETWELFAYIRNYLMPSHSFRMAENGAQELEVFDTSKHETGYVYMPVMRC